MQSANKRLIDGWSSGFVGALNSGLDGIGKLISLASRSHSSESRFNSASGCRAASIGRRRLGAERRRWLDGALVFFDSRSEGLFVKRIGNRWRSGRPGLSLFQCSTIATALIATVQIKGPSAPSISWMALREAISVIMPKNPATPPQIKSTIASMISPPSFASIFQQKTATVLAPYKGRGKQISLTLLSVPRGRKTQSGLVMNLASGRTDAIPALSVQCLQEEWHHGQKTTLD